MIDIHTHVLPGIDDGSSDLNETALLLTEEKRQGVTTVVATPHFYAQKTSVASFLQKREAAWEQTCAWAQQQEGIPRILKAAEVYYFPGMGKAAALPQLTIEGTSVLLLEMPFAQWTKSVYQEVKEIIEKQKLTVLLAHLERFYEYQKDRSVLEAVLDLPVYVQINAGSLLDWGKRRLDKKILDTGLPVVLGSDCHNMRHRKPNLTEGREMIRRKWGDRILEQMDAAAQELLGEQTGE